MTEQFDNTNKGVLFIKHDRLSDRSPTMTGKININGEEFYLSGWTNYKKSDGEKYLSLAVTPVNKNNIPKNQMDGEIDIPF